MKTYKAEILVTFSFDVEAENDDLAGHKAMTMLGESKFYDDGVDFEFGYLCFHDVCGLEIYDSED